VVQNAATTFRFIVFFNLLQHSRMIH